MNKQKNNDTKTTLKKKSIASIQLTLIILSLFSFSFIIGQTTTVSAHATPGQIHCHGTGGPHACNTDGTGGTLPTVRATTPTDTAGQLAPETINAADLASIGALTTTVPSNTLIPSSPTITTTSAGCGIDTNHDGIDDCSTKPIETKTTGACGDNNGDGRDDCNNAQGGGTDIFSKIFGGGKGEGGIDSILGGLQWAVAAFGAGQLLGGLLGFNTQNTFALSAALAGTAFTYQALSSAGIGTAGAAGAALGVGAIIFVLLYKEVETEITRFQCLPWQAPVGGNNCELCNDENLPCSEYRCRSLGQNCELVNVGTEQEQCVNVNPNDVNPPIIQPWQEPLTFGHSYTDVKLSPPGPGFSITNDNSSDGCLKAFTPLTFGITTDEPSQCRIDFKSTNSFEDMIAYIGTSNLYAYNHTEIFALPGAQAFENSSFELENGKDLTFYLRCKDRNGNTNEAEYAVRFCMDPSPDTTPPSIKATSVNNNGCVAANTDAAEVEFYTDEPADCKWSHVDQNYNDMPNNMTCSLNTYQINTQQLFTCKANLTGIARDGTDFYVRCKDQPGTPENNRNKNEQSYTFNLKGSTELKLKNTLPNSTVFGGVSPAPIELYAETLFGCNEGQSICYYTPNNGNNNNPEDYIQFFDTNNQDGISTQRLDLGEGTHEYSIRCIDAGGNVAENNITFEVDIDTTAPVIARIYEEEQKLKIITVRESQCAYTFNNCDFTFNEGTEMPFANSTIHIAEWNEDKTYYIKCRDQYLNENADCSAIIRPSKNFL